MNVCRSFIDHCQNSWSCYFCTSLNEIKFNLEKKESTVKRTKTDFQFEIQTTSTSLEPLDIFFVQQQHSTSSELGLNIFKLAGEFICESPWSPRSGKPPTPEKQHINKLRHRLTTIINLIGLCSQNANSNWIGSPGWILESDKTVTHPLVI